MAKTSLAFHRAPTEKRTFGAAKPPWGHFGNRAGWKGRILPPDVGPSTLQAELYKVTQLSAPFYEALESSRKKNHLFFFWSGLNGFDQKRAVFLCLFPSSNPWGRSAPACWKRKDLMNCKRTKLYLFSQGYALVGSVWVFFCCSKPTMENPYKHPILAAHGAPESGNTWFQRATLTLNGS